MKIAIGTTSSPKVKAIEEGAKKCIYFEGQEIEIIPFKADSGISAMPKTLEEVMEGAKNRSINTKKEIEADLYIGAEGGTAFFGEKAYLFGVVYIENKSGEGHYGFSNMMEMPKIFEKGVYEDGKELAEIIDSLTGIKKEHQEKGSFGEWSDGMLDRKNQFLIAFLSAICPFYNNFYKK